MMIGLNLFSLRNYLGSEESFLEAAKALKEMGYDYLQYSGGIFDADRIKRVSDESGIPIVLTHVPMARILEDTEALIEEHRRFGCKYIGLGMMPLDLAKDKEKCYATIAALEAAAEKTEAAGCKFFYHHHHFEFFRHDGETIFDLLIKNAPHVHFTLDSYWLQFGGVSICETIDRLKGRAECIHLKDYMIALKNEEKTGFEPRFAPVGDGNINFAEVIRHAKAAGAEYFFVEQDNAAKLPDPLGQVERSIRYLKANF